MKQFEVSVEMPGFTSMLDMKEELSADFLAGFNDTKLAEGKFTKGVNFVVSASVSGDSDDIEDGEAKVFVAIKLNVSAQTDDAAERVATDSRRLLVSLADVLAEQAGGSIGLDEGEHDVVEVEELVAMSYCSDCGNKVEQIIGCHDGAEICHDCFNSGLH